MNSNCSSQDCPLAEWSVRYPLNVARNRIDESPNLERTSRSLTSVYLVERRTKGTQQKRPVAGATRRFSWWR